jgi:hypothetical protein
MEEPLNKFGANHQTRIQTYPSLIVVGELFNANQTLMSSEFLFQQGGKCVLKTKFCTKKVHHQINKQQKNPTFTSCSC